MSTIVDIDGSVLEGGGQILRISISLSAILGVPVRVRNIRAGRSKPGLAAQHLKGIELVADMCGARLKGASIGSTEIEFIPGTIQGGHYVADTKTAGSISLLLQVALPCSLFAAGAARLELRGGTNADMAPQIDYMGEVFRYMLNKFGGDFAMDVHRRGIPLNMVLRAGLLSATHRFYYECSVADLWTRANKGLVRLSTWLLASDFEI